MSTFEEAAGAHLASVDHDKSDDWVAGFIAAVTWAREHDAKVRAEALREVRDAWIIPGRVPTHHHRMRIQLRRDWPVLAGALDRIEQEAGD